MPGFLLGFQWTLQVVSRLRYRRQVQLSLVSTETIYPSRDSVQVQQKHLLFGNERLEATKSEQARKGVLSLSLFTVSM